MHLDLSMLVQYTLITKQKYNLIPEIQKLFTSLSQTAEDTEFSKISKSSTYTQHKKSYRIGIKTNQYIYLSVISVLTKQNNKVIGDKNAAGEKA